MRRIALLVGSASYDASDLTDLPGVAEDLRSLGDVLADPSLGGYEVLKLQDLSKGEIETAIESLLSTLGFEDSLLLYFSGHGKKDVRNQLYLAVKATSSDKLRSSAISVTDFVAKGMQDCKARQQVLILDCCFSGAFSHGLISKGDKELHLVDAFGSASGFEVLTATNKIQPAYADDSSDQLRSSVFTSILVEGIRDGSADVTRDGIITVSDLESFAQRELNRRKIGMTPKRWVFGGEGGGIVVAKSPLPVVQDIPTQGADGREKEGIRPLYWLLSATVGLALGGLLIARIAFPPNPTSKFPEPRGEKPKVGSERAEQEAAAEFQNPGILAKQVKPAGNPPPSPKSRMLAEPLGLSADGFSNYLNGVDYRYWRPEFLVVHQTTFPSLDAWNKASKIGKVALMGKVFSLERNWSGGPHLILDGKNIWVLNMLNQRGIHSPSWNSKSLGIEIIGDYDKEKFEGRIKGFSTGVLATLCRFFKMKGDSIRFHRDDPRTEKKCPGKNVRNDELYKTVSAQLAVWEGKKPS